MGLAGDRGVAPPRRSTPGSPSSSRLALASLPQPDLEVRSLRNAARQYPCARPLVVFQHPARSARWRALSFLSFSLPQLSWSTAACGQLSLGSHGTPLHGESTMNEFA